MAKEYIERTEAIMTAMNYDGNGNAQDASQDIASALGALPAADVRPVVTCRECKHRGWVQEPCHGKSVDYCRILDRCVDKEFFCADGEKREVQDED